MTTSIANTASPSPHSNAGVVIVGGGHGGDAVAAALRQQGWNGPIRIVSEERYLPYERPPLSKAFLKERLPVEKLALRPDGFYKAQQIEVLQGARVQHIHRSSASVELAGGEMLPYEYLVIATGSKHRRLPAPGVDLPFVHQLRSIYDAQRLLQFGRPGKRIAVIGGGYVGLETAASLHSLGVKPIVIEREQRLLSRVASEVLAGFVREVHIRKGTEVSLSTQVEAILGQGDRCDGVQLRDGRLIECDAVLVGIGALANDDLARSAGLDCNDGVLVDLQCRSSDQRIFAIGDCARRDVLGYGAMLRLESIPSTQEQAKVVAATLVGRPASPSGAPWFWSDQFGFKIQIAGIVACAGKSFTRGSVREGSFAVYHLDETRRLRAVESVGLAPEFMLGKSLIQSGATIPTELEQAPIADLREALRSVLTV